MYTTTQNDPIDIANGPATEWKNKRYAVTSEAELDKLVKTEAEFKRRVQNGTVDFQLQRILEDGYSALKIAISDIDNPETPMTGKRLAELFKYECKQTVQTTR